MSRAETRITWKYVKRRCKRYIRKWLLKIKRWKEQRNLPEQKEVVNEYIPPHGEIIQLSKTETDSICLQIGKEENGTRYDFASVQEMTDFFQMKTREENIKYLKGKEKIKECDQFLLSLIWDNAANGTGSDLGYTKRILDIWEETEDRKAIELLFTIFTGTDLFKYVEICNQELDRK